MINKNLGAKRIDNQSFIDQLSDHLFWDVAKDEIDAEKSKTFIVVRILEYGLLSDWKILKAFYGLDEIKQVATQARRLDPKTLSFLSVIFRIPKDLFRCYEETQSARSFWPS